MNNEHSTTSLSSSSSQQISLLNYQVDLPHSGLPSTSNPLQSYFTNLATKAYSNDEQRKNLEFLAQDLLNETKKYKDYDDDLTDMSSFYKRLNNPEKGQIDLSYGQIDNFPSSLVYEASESISTSSDLNNKPNNSATDQLKIVEIDATKVDKTEAKSKPKSTAKKRKANGTSSKEIANNESTTKKKSKPSHQRKNIKLANFYLSKIRDHLIKDT